MSYAATASAAQTTTMTEARVRVVMQKVSANLTAFVVAGHVTAERAQKWIEDLHYLQIAEVLDYFEIQVEIPGRPAFGIRYTVSADGSLQQNSASGGLDTYGIPRGTTIRFYAHLYDGKLPLVREYLVARGWNFNGKHLDAAESDRRVFSTDGYGVTRAKLGDWP